MRKVRLPEFLVSIAKLPLIIGLAFSVLAGLLSSIIVHTVLDPEGESSRNLHQEFERLLDNGDYEGFRRAAFRHIDQSDSSADHLIASTVIVNHLRRIRPCDAACLSGERPPSRNADQATALIRLLTQVSGSQRGLNLSRTDLREIDFSPDIDLALDFPDFEYSSFQGANLSGASLKRANLRACDLSNAVLRGTDLTEANLEAALFRNADLREASLARANLTNAVLSGANLSGSDLRSADLKGALIEEALLNSALLDGLQNWRLVRIRNTVILNVTDAPAGFTNWAVENGAIAQQER